MSTRPDLRLPRARRAEELIIEQVADELLVYDNERAKAHRLNRAAALIWRHCDGKNSLATVLAALRAEGLPSDREVVDLALAELTRAKLVEPVVDWGAIRFRSRRTLLKRLGLMTAAALALPIVQSIVAPSIAQAASCVRAGGVCNNGNLRCCVGLTCSTGMPPHVCM
jgi:hypothetical protein